MIAARHADFAPQNGAQTAQNVGEIDGNRMETSEKHRNGQDRR
ncbi:hypothetical protein [Pandoraea nosoerga]|nr:hypothetical protein [Pandoraea nosoerga]